MSSIFIYGLCGREAAEHKKKRAHERRDLSSSSDLSQRTEEKNKRNETRKIKHPVQTYCARHVASDTKVRHS